MRWRRSAPSSRRGRRSRGAPRAWPASPRSRCSECPTRRCRRRATAPAASRRRSSPRSAWRPPARSSRAVSPAWPSRRRQSVHLPDRAVGGPPEDVQLRSLPPGERGQSRSWRCRRCRADSTGAAVHPPACVHPARLPDAVVRAAPEDRGPGAGGGGGRRRGGVGGLGGAQRGAGQPAGRSPGAGARRPGRLTDRVVGGAPEDIKLHP